MISLSTTRHDRRTLVVVYNGRRLTSILGAEDFQGKRVERLSAPAIIAASGEPITSGLLPSSAGYYPQARGHRASRPAGDWRHALLLCLDGEGVVDLPAERHRLTAGSLALLRPFEYHSYAADDRHPWSLYWIHFSGRFAADYYEALTASGRRTCTSVAIDAELIHAFENVMRACAQGGDHRSLVQASGALHHLLTDLYVRLGPAPAPIPDVRTRIERSMRAMQAHPDATLSIREFAAAAHLSPMYFAEKFREISGEAPHTYLNRQRIARACELLATTDLKIEIVASSVGFRDAYYFSRAFKQRMGSTPSQYRTQEKSRVSRGNSI